jgi:hypothetical protein
MRRVGCYSQNVFVDECCTTCNRPADAMGLQLGLIDDTDEYVYLVCVTCAAGIDPAFFTAWQQLLDSELGLLQDCQSALWQDECALRRGLSAFGLKLLDYERRLIVFDRAGELAGIGTWMERARAPWQAR